MDGGVGEALGTGVCAVLRVHLGVPALARGLGGGGSWKAEVVWLGQVLEATRGRGGGTRAGREPRVGYPTLRFLDTRQDGASTLVPVLPLLRGGLPRCQEAVAATGSRLQRGWSGVGGRGAWRLLWDRVALSGHPRVHSALTPRGPLCSAGWGGRQQRAPASSGQGGRAAESCSHGYGVLHGEAPGAC